MAEELSAEEILQRVAAGSLDPADAAAMLDEIAPRQPSEDVDGTDVATTRGDHVYDAGTGDALVGRTLGAEDSTPPSTQRLLVRATSRRVRIIGDPTVATVAVEGEHTAR